MLYNLMLMLQRRGRHEECRELIRHAVTLRHSDDLYGVFRLFAAFEEALSGNNELAGQHLAALPANAIKDDIRPLRVMTELLLARPEAADGRAFFKDARNKLRAAFKMRSPSRAGQYARAGYRRFMRAILRDSNDLGFRLWGWQYYWGTRWLWIPVILLLGAGFAAAFVGASISTEAMTAALPGLLIALLVFASRFRRK
jgi:hypothetical protein